MAGVRLRFAAMLAVRHLRSGGGQTILTVSAVATGVTLVVFISALLFGVRAHVRDMLTDMLPHVTLEPREREPAHALAAGRLTAARVQQRRDQRKDIDDWARVVAVIRAVPHVTAIAPVVAGPASVGAGEKQVGVQLTGADPDALDAVTPLAKYLVSGHYRGLRHDEILLSYKVAQDLRVDIGDRVRVTSETAAETCTVGGVFDTGQEMTTAYVPLRAAQSLFGTGTAVQRILIHADDLFSADEIADRLNALLPYEAKSWSRQYPQFVSWLGVYRSIAFLVSGFALAASGFATAAVLIVAVLQKRRQIGILKSMGARRRQILQVFLLEGLGIAIIGSLVGASLGTGVVLALSVVHVPPSHPGAVPERLFPSELTPSLILIAIGAAILTTVLAAVIPARQAASLDPTEVMR